MVLVELDDLADNYPLADYYVGRLRLVTLKRHTNTRFLIFHIQLIILYGITLVGGLFFYGN